ncbi:MAG TPA: DNA polymerase IV [Clostridiaceae bacterium]|nr:DNA polymerase IV [Clostridiaceae bacterium]
MDRTILHCDCNGFYASVECILSPELKNVPMAVCGNPENRRGIILAKNELAKKYKIQTAETIWQAKKKCPDLVLVPPHHDEYKKYSKIVNKIYQRYTEKVEPFGIDESWLDVTDSIHLFGDGKQIADTLRKVVRNETGLTISVGVSFNKVLAKLGSDYKKPDATTVINRENFKSIVHPLPVSSLLYVGKKARKILNKLNIYTIGDLANSDKDLIISRLGKSGKMIHEYANGIDDSPVKSIYEAEPIKSVGNGMTFKRNLRGLSDITISVNTLSDTVATRLRKYGLKCSTVQISIKDPDFKTISRQKPLPNPTNLAKEIAQQALELIKGSWKLNAPIRALTITGTNLVPAHEEIEQMSLFSDCNNERKRQEQLETAIDKIREKYGSNAISFGSVINNCLGIAEPDDED